MWSDVDDRAARDQFGGGLNPEIEGMLQSLTPDTLWLIKAWRLYRDGHLWFAGAAGDQPARYLEAMALLTSTVERRQADRARRDRARDEGGFGRKRMKIHGA